MTMREVDGTTEAPRQYWTLGGMQFIHQPDFSPRRKAWPPRHHV